VTAQIVDALPQLGGQLTALYPEKYIFDVGGFPKILAKEFVKGLSEQALQFHGKTHLNETIMGLERRDGQLVLQTEGGDFPSKSIVIAAGIGAFTPRRLPQTVAHPWYGKGIHDVVTDPEVFRGKRIVIIGGGDTAFDWSHQLLDRAATLTLVHRSDRFRAHAATVNEVQRAVAEGRMGMHVFHELHDIMSMNGTLTGVVLRDTKTKETFAVACDVILPMLGYVSDLGALAQWGLTLEKEEIVVNSCMETGQAGIYAAGDVTTYPGKLKLISSGFGEAATAVNQAVHWIYPEKKVTPGHSSNMAIFGQKDD
jgi:thioredoxin reductase (NADPH)